MTKKSEEESQEIIDRFFSKAAVLKQWLDSIRQKALKDKYTRSLRGRVRWYDVPERGAENYRKIISQIERYAGNQPIQACIPGWVNIFIQGQGYVPIQSAVGQKVQVWDGQTFAKARVAAAGPKELIRITMKNGQTLECSPEHKILFRTPKNKELWRTAGALADAWNNKSAANQRNYRVAITDEVPEWNLPLNIPEPKTSTVHNAGYSSVSQIRDLQDLGVWLGRLASDGNVWGGNKGHSGRVTLIIAEHEKAILPYLKEVSSWLGNPCEQAYEEEGKEPVYHIVLNAATLARQMQEIKVKERIPAFVWRSRNLLIGYLRGLFDGDGGYHPDGPSLTFGKGDCHLDWAREVQQALLLLGIRTRMKCYPGDKGSIRLRIQKYDSPKFCSLIGFVNQKKQKRVETIVGNPIKGTAAYGRALAIKSIERTGLFVEMYDVVDSETHRFMANGFIVHNSCADMVKMAMAKFYLDLRNGSWTNDVIYPHARLLLTVHDELVGECQEEHAGTNKQLGPVPLLLKSAMEWSYQQMWADRWVILDDGHKQKVRSWLKEIDNQVDIKVADYWEKD